MYSISIHYLLVSVIKMIFFSEVYFIKKIIQTSVLLCLQSKKFQII